MGAPESPRKQSQQQDKQNENRGNCGMDQISFHPVLTSQDSTANGSWPGSMQKLNSAIASVGQ
jgi:hypothetical protein